MRHYRAWEKLSSKPWGSEYYGAGNPTTFLSPSDHLHRHPMQHRLLSHRGIPDGHSTRLPPVQVGYYSNRSTVSPDPVHPPPLPAHQTVKPNPPRQANPSAKKIGCFMVTPPLFSPLQLLSTVNLPMRRAYIPDIFSFPMLLRSRTRLRQRVFVRWGPCRCMYRTVIYTSRKALSVYRIRWFRGGDSSRAGGTGLDLGRLASNKPPGVDAKPK
ncbi:hypothetical protein HOY82DRAFT_98586 [Tuber indicum]|nr:hypothetical protein HOY82DRAFT_98586 [Tuber indicum]